MKNSSHFPSDAYMRCKSLYFSYRSRGRPTKQCQAKMEPRNSGNSSLMSTIDSSQPNFTVQLWNYTGYRPDYTRNLARWLRKYSDGLKMESYKYIHLTLVFRMGTSYYLNIPLQNDLHDCMKTWKLFPHYWSFLWGFHGLSVVKIFCVIYRRFSATVFVPPLPAHQL